VDRTTGTDRDALPESLRRKPQGSYLTQSGERVDRRRTVAAKDDMAAVRKEGTVHEIARQLPDLD